MDERSLYDTAIDLLFPGDKSAEVVRYDGADLEPTHGMNYREDSGWTNPLTGAGDPAETGEAYFVRARQMTFQELASLYYGDDLAFRIVSKLPNDALKKAPRVVNKQATPEQVQRVQDKWDAWEMTAKVQQAATFARLFGDAGLWFASNTDQMTPYQLGERLSFAKHLDRRTLVVARYYTDPQAETLGTPSAYSVIPIGMQMSYKAFSAQVHETRIPRFVGTRLDPVEKMYNLGWNMSVLHRVHNAIRDMGETWSGIATLLRELSIKVLSVKGLNMSNATRPDLIRFRLQQARRNLSTQHMLAVDADSETFSRVDAGALTGAAAILELLLVRMGAVAEMPVTVLFGRTPSGLNATGESDLALWDDSVTTYQNNELRPPMRRMLTAIATSELGLDAPRKGWDFEFPALRTQTPEQETAAIRSVAEIDSLLIDKGVFTAEQIATLRGGPKGHWRPDYTSLDVSLAAALSRMPPEPQDDPEKPLPPPPPANDSGDLPKPPDGAPKPPPPPGA